MPLLCTTGAATARAFGGRRTVPLGEGEFDVYFPGPSSTASINWANSVVVTADYDTVGQDIDSLSFQVNFNGGAYTQWAQSDFSATDSTIVQETYSSADAGWSGVGTYRFFCVARRTSTGTYDVTSATITLTVT